MSDPENHQGLRQVIEGGYCIGCGACAVVDPSIRIEFNAIRQYQAILPDLQLASPSAGQVCPFAAGNPDETELGRELYGSFSAFDDKIGHHLATFAGWVEEGDYRASGSSGGMGSWLLCELLERGLVDRVVQVSAAGESALGAPLFQFSVVSTAGEIRANAKSRYYPVELSGVVRQMLAEDFRYAVVGIPCFLKSLRLLARQNPVLKQRLRYTVGLVCGHLKSAAFAELLAWQCGIAPDHLRAVDFRRKITGQKASQYGVSAKGLLDGREVIRTGANRELFGSNWGLGFFKYKACEYCDDVVAELADITIGDAWLPEYENDDRGTNIVIARHPDLLELCRAAASTGRIHLEALPVEKVVASQDAGFRHRREGLAYRLHLAQAAGTWHPPKRVGADDKHIPNRRKRLLKLRYRLSELSHEAFAEARKKGDLGIFMTRVKPLATAHGRLCQSPRKAMVDRAKRLVLGVLRFLKLEGWVRYFLK